MREKSLTEISWEEWFRKVLRKKGLVLSIRSDSPNTLVLVNGFFSSYLPNNQLRLTMADLEGIESEEEFETLLEWKLAFD